MDYHRLAPLSSATWRELQNNGKELNEMALREAIFHGGIEDDIRTEVWAFLLHHRQGASRVGGAG